MEDVMKTFLMGSLLSLSLVACSDKGDSGDTAGADGGTTDSGTGGDGTDGSEGGDGGGGEFGVAGSWTTDCSYTLEITNGSMDYYLGFAETGAGEDGWYGEDCGDGSTCHPVGMTGATLGSVHPVYCGGAGIDAVEAGASTLLTGSMDANLTYAVAGADGTCWTWGNDPSYFSTCTAI
jgi:hypothetical protein